MRSRTRTVPAGWCCPRSPGRRAEPSSGDWYGGCRSGGSCRRRGRRPVRPPRRTRPSPARRKPPVRAARRVVRKLDVLVRRSLLLGGTAATVYHAVGPRSRCRVVWPRPAVLPRPHRRGEVSDRVPRRFVQEYDVLAVGDPDSTEPHPHAPPQRLGEGHPFRQGLGDEEAPHSTRRQRSLLPRQTHQFVPSAQIRSGAQAIEEVQDRFATCRRWLSSRKCPPSSRWISASGTSVREGASRRRARRSRRCAPDREHRDLAGAQVLVQLRVERGVGRVVAEQLQLHQVVARSRHHRRSWCQVSGLTTLSSATPARYCHRMPVQRQRAADRAPRSARCLLTSVVPDELPEVLDEARRRTRCRSA